MASRAPSKARRWLLRLACVPLLAWAGFRAAVAFWPYPRGIDRPPAAGSFIEDRDGVPLAALVGPDGQWQLPLACEQVSPHLRAAIVAVEDGRFYEHGGVDWRSALGAAWQDLAARGPRRGASTLTMQVHRLRDPRPRTFLGKLEQAIRAEQIERQSDKRAILTEYLNRAPFGGNLVGAGAASWRYFGKPCRDLSLGEAALLAGLPQSPNRLRPDRWPARALARRQHVLDRMLACGMITASQHDEAAAEPMTAAWRPLPQAGGGNGAMPALTTIAAQYPGQVLRTTLAADAQRHTCRAAEAHLASLEPSGISAVAVVVLDTASSELLATVSLSRGGAAADVDLSRRPRSTGSAVKPFIYAAAFDAGACSPRAVLDDSPTAWPGYAPNNYDRAFRGRLTAAEALAESRNVPAMVVLGQVGVERARGVMQSFGLRTLGAAPKDYGLALAVGGADATPMEMAEAYATLARGGAAMPVSVLRGAAARPGGAALRAASCWEVIAALSGAERTRRVCPEAVASGVAWKTGTSSGHRDAWCCAVTPRRTVVVWLGNPGGAGSLELVGQDAAAPLALSLIASLDPGGGPGWPPAPVASDAPRAVGARTAASLVIVSPAARQEIVFNADLPADRQQVLLKAASRSAGVAQTIWWFVDDQPVATGERDEQAWWAPTPGAHRVRAVDADGHAAAVEINVLR